MARLHVVVLLLVVLPGLASADHTAESRATRLTPYVLQPGEWKVGVRAVEVGLGGHPLLERVQLGTNPWPWGLNAIGLPSYNFDAKYEFYRDPTLSLSVASGHTMVEFDREFNSRLRITPLELGLAVRTGADFTLGISATYNWVAVNVDVRANERANGSGRAGVANLVGRGFVEYRKSQRTAFVMRGELVGYQRARADLSGTLRTSDMPDGVQAGGYIETNLEPPQLGYNVGASFLWSWAHFNLELGVQYGYLSLPGGVVTPVQLPLPVFDMFWRF